MVHICLGACKYSKHRTEELLNQLYNDPINVHISFTEVDPDKLDTTSFWLVYNSNLTVANALAQAFSLGSTDTRQDVVVLMCHTILRV